MSPHISIQWVGYRRDSNNGAVWGWFTEAGKETEPRRPYHEEMYGPAHCYIFWGKIGKSLYVEKRELTWAFTSEVSLRKKNYKQQNPEKLMTRWGKSFDEDLSMFIMTMRLRG